MTLATQCPHCHTTFKVANEQLQSQAGLVRCGICQQVFNGAEQLIETEEDSKQARSASLSPPPPPNPLPPVEEATQQFDNDAQLATNIDTNPVVEEEFEQLTFIRQAKPQKRFTWIWVLASFVLLLLLLAQLTYQLRDFIAAFYPPSKPTLVRLCQYAHCQIQLPKQLDTLSFEADALHTLPREHTFELNLLMRNHSALTQTWPHIELTLKNAQRQTVLKRVFTPAEYLANPTEVSKGFAAHQEYAVNLYFELDQVTASDYAVAIFYP